MWINVWRSPNSRPTSSLKESIGWKWLNGKLTHLSDLQSYANLAIASIHGLLDTSNWLTLCFGPQTKGMLDTANFDEQFTTLPPQLSPYNANVDMEHEKLFENFSYTRGSFELNRSGASIAPVAEIAGQWRLAEQFLCQWVQELARLPSKHYCCCCCCCCCCCLGNRVSFSSPKFGIVPHPQFISGIALSISCKIQHEKGSKVPGRSASVKRFFKKKYALRKFLTIHAACSQFVYSVAYRWTFTIFRTQPFISSELVRAEGCDQLPRYLVH